MFKNIKTETIVTKTEMIINETLVFFKILSLKLNMLTPVNFPLVKAFLKLLF